MARLDGVLHNRTALTGLVFALIAILVAYKTVQTQPFQGGLQTRQEAMQSFNVAHDFMRAKLRKSDGDGQDPIISGVGYPLVITAVAYFDSHLNSALPCHNAKIACDPGAFQTLFALQYGVALLGLVAIFLLAQVLSRSWSVALLTLVLAVAAGSYGGLAGQLSPLVWLQTCMLLFLVCIALAATRDRWGWSLAGGVALGCAALFQPQILLLALVTGVIFCLFNARTPLNIEHPLAHAIALTLGITCVAAGVFTLLQEVDPTRLIWQQLADAASHRFPDATDALSYITATPGIFMRGLWVGTPLLTVLGLIHLPSLLRFSSEDARLGSTLLVTIPVVSLVAVNTAMTANWPEYNVGLVFLLCYATAYLIGRTDVRRKFWEDKKRGPRAQKSL